jgi:hypothetical protein
MSERNAVQRAFDQFGTEAGFEKKSGSWYRHAEEVIAVSNLQKSQYGPQYYLNQGFWLRQLGDERYPKEWKCQVGARLGTLFPEESSRIDRLLDLEHEMADDERVAEIVGLLRKRLLPLIEQGGSIAGLRSMVDDGTLKGAAIMGPAQQVLASVAR